MDMLISIAGVVPADDEYKKMLQVYNTCLDAGVDIPNQVREYLNLGEEEEPDEDGCIIDIDDAIEEEGDIDYEDGCTYTIDIGKLPKNIKFIKIRTRWF